MQVMPICTGVDFEPVVAGRVVLEDTREPRLVVPKAGAVVRWDDRAVKQQGGGVAEYFLRLEYSQGGTYIFSNSGAGFLVITQTWLGSCFSPTCT